MTRSNRFMQPEQIRVGKALSAQDLYGPGDLVFDIGANTGDKTNTFLANGARVVCFEPQPECIVELRRKYGHDKRVVVVEKGVAAEHGKMPLHVCSYAHTISTFSDEWKKGRFSDYEWDQSVEVDVITLDEAIQAYGRPQYIKIDVEGFEYHVLCGLSKAVPYLSFEFTFEFMEQARRCVLLLEERGYKHFNYAEGEVPQLAISDWVPSKELFAKLERSTDPLFWGDIYASHVDSNGVPSFTAMDASLEKSSVTVMGYEGAMLVTGDQARCNPGARSGLLNTLHQLRQADLWRDSQPLRLHLGCGEQYLNGYINIDFPPSEHSVMNVKADICFDIARLEFPPDSVDEIRLHHVFEHFNRVTALGLLIKWHTWLKVGGKLHIETPDLMGSAYTLLSNASWKVKSGVVRHLMGDQAAPWAYHIDQWFPERFERTLKALGYSCIETEQQQWPHEPYLSNMHVRAIKEEVIDENHLLQSAEQILWESTVADSEEKTHQIWCQQLKRWYFNRAPESSDDVNTGLADFNELRNTSVDVKNLPLDEIHDFNQRARDRWIATQAGKIPSGSFVLDVGAGTCPYRHVFAHCNYKTHDFKKYAGEKLGGGTAYGEIDYISDILALPLEDMSVDVVLCTEVLEHVPEPVRALKELVRVVKPGGKLILTAPLGSGLHQLPFHYYGGFSPEWYRHFAEQFSCEVNEIMPNGGFFRLMAQESARIANLYAKYPELHGPNTREIYRLFVEQLPRLLFEWDTRRAIDQFTVGYHVVLTKKRTDLVQLQAQLKRDPTNIELLLKIASLVTPEESRHYLLSAYCLNPNHQGLQGSGIHIQAV